MLRIIFSQSFHNLKFIYKNHLVKQLHNQSTIYLQRTACPEYFSETYTKFNLVFQPRYNLWYFLIKTLLYYLARNTEIVIFWDTNFL